MMRMIRNSEIITILNDDRGADYSLPYPLQSTDA